MVAIILSFYNVPTLQLVLNMQLNFFFLAFIMGYKVREVPRERKMQIFNEIAILGTIYIMLGFLGEVITTAGGREMNGYFLLSFTFFNFSVNIIPIFFDAVRYFY